MNQFLLWFLYVVVPVAGLSATVVLGRRAKRKEG